MTTESAQTKMANTKEQKEISNAKPASVDGKTEQAAAEKSSSKEKNAKPRHRASVACASCRDRRIRCVVPPGDKECTQCRRSGVECVIKNDDERRRYVSARAMDSKRLTPQQTNLKSIHVLTYRTRSTPRDDAKRPRARTTTSKPPAKDATWQPTKRRQLAGTQSNRVTKRTKRALKSRKPAFTTGRLPLS